MKKTIIISALFSLVMAVTGCQKLDDYLPGHNPGSYNKADATVALDWYRLQCRILLERNSALNGGQQFGYIGIALYEAVRNENKHSVSLSSKLNTMPLMPDVEDKPYDWVLSANAALASMLRSFNTGLTPANTASIDSLENAYNQKSSTQSGSEKFTRSVAYGKSIATAVYNWFLTDNYNASNAGYVPPAFPGAWIPTPPAFANGIQPYLSTAKLLLAANSKVVIPLKPYPYSEQPNSDFYKMVKKVYDVNKALTQEQKNIALFYIDQGNGLGYTPPGHDFLIITQAILEKKVGLVDAAETYAKAGIAERDATILCFTSKYINNQIRPVSYIRAIIDTGWLPFIVTPPHPEYPAAHAMITGSAMKAAAEVLGDQINFSDHSYDFRGWTPRTFNSLFAVGEEAGISRLYGGIHYKNSIDQGLSAAKKIGNNVGDIKLQE